jgi:hypothetical protein
MNINADSVYDNRVAICCIWDVCVDLIFWLPYTSLLQDVAVVKLTVPELNERDVIGLGLLSGPVEIV